MFKILGTGEAMALAVAYRRAHVQKIAPGKTFKEFILPQLTAADEMRRTIAAKHGVEAHQIF